LNRVTVTQEPFGQTLTASYDAVGNRTLLQDSLGGVLTSLYDADNRLTSRQFGGASQTPLRLDLTYYANGEVKKISRYSDLAGTNLIGTTSYVYDSAGQLTNQQVKNGSGTSLNNYTLTYDSASNLKTQKLNGGSTTTYTYNAANELTNDTANSYSFDL